MKIQRTLRRYGYKPYKILPVQELTELHKRKRLTFCQEMLRRINENPDIFQQICWTDESSFSTAGIFNRKNRRSWENKHNRQRKVKQIKKSGRKSIKIWCGIFQNRVVGPLFFNYKLTGRTYLTRILPKVSDMLEEQFTGDQLNNMIWHQDGASPHNVVEVREHLNNQFPVWIGNNGTILWPPNSPDLTPLDSFLWGLLKDKVNSGENNNLQSIKAKVEDEINNLNNDNNNNYVSRCLENLRKRYQLCIDNNGGHFEQYL